MGVRAVLPPDLVTAERAPTSNDKAYVRGTLWLDFVGLASYQWSGVSWIELGSGVVGDIATLTGDTGGAIAPVGGNISILGGAAGGASVAGTAGTLTINIAQATDTQRGTLEVSTNAESVTGTSILVAVTPASLTARLAAPGTIGGTTPGAATFTNLTANGTVNLNTAGAGITSIGTGGTGAVNIGNATGNTAITGTLTTSNTITALLGNIDAFLGSMSSGTSMTAGTSVTATLGNITATNGNFVKGTAGNKDVYTSVATTTAAGANSAGTVTLVGGTATVSTTAIAAGSKVRLTRQSVGATGANPLGMLSVGTIVAATSFVINAWSATDATALAATDVSSIWWEIVN